jgi:hypothetical protein
MTAVHFPPSHRNRTRRGAHCERGHNLPRPAPAIPEAEPRGVAADFPAVDGVAPQQE